jgi:8-oxo-dGTP pyrophosphatase MutT (NUDIX family)
MVQQETYPRRPSLDAPIDKPLPVVSESDRGSILVEKLDEVARAVHVRAGLPEVPHSPSKGFVHFAAVNEGVYTFAVYAPLVNRVAGTVQFDAKSLTAEALHAESLRVLKEFMAATPTSPTTGVSMAAVPTGAKAEDKEEENVAKTVALGKDDDVGQIDQKMDKAPYTAQTEKLVPLPVDECDPFELEIGTAVEKEHTDNEKEASTIARQHLREDPAYYRKLYKAKMVQDDEIGKKLAAAAEDKWGAVKESLDVEVPGQKPKYDKPEILDMRDTRERDWETGKPIPGTGSQMTCQRCTRTHDIVWTIRDVYGKVWQVGSGCGQKLWMGAEPPKEEFAKVKSSAEARMKKEWQDKKNARELGASQELKKHLLALRWPGFKWELGDFFNRKNVLIGRSKDAVGGKEVHDRFEKPGEAPSSKALQDMGSAVLHSWLIFKAKELMPTVLPKVDPHGLLADRLAKMAANITVDDYKARNPIQESLTESINDAWWVIGGEFLPVGDTTTHKRYLANHPSEFGATPEERKRIADEGHTGPTVAALYKKATEHGYRVGMTMGSVYVESGLSTIDAKTFNGIKHFVRLTGLDKETKIGVFRWELGGNAYGDISLRRFMGASSFGEVLYLRQYAMQESLAEFASQLHPTRADELKPLDLILGFEDAKGYHHSGEHIVWRTDKTPDGKIRIQDQNGKTFIFPPDHKFHDVSFGPDHPEHESVNEADFIVDPAGIGAAFDAAAASCDRRNKKFANKLDSMPDGTKIAGWEKFSIPGEKGGWWRKGKKNMPSCSVYKEMGTKLIPVVGEPFYYNQEESLGSVDGPAGVPVAPMATGSANQQPKEDVTDTQSVTPPKSNTGTSRMESWEQEFRETLEKLPSDADWYSTDGGFSRIWMVSQTSGTSFFWYLPSGKVNRTNHPPGYMPSNGQQISASHPRVKDTIRRFFSFDKFENLLLRADNPTYQGVPVGVKDKSREDDECKEEGVQKGSVRIKFEFEGKMYTGTMLQWGASETALMDVKLDTDLPSKGDGKTFKAGTVVRIGKRNYQKLGETLEFVPKEDLKDPLDDDDKLKFKHAIAIVVKDSNSVLLGICTHDDEREGKLVFPGGHVEKSGRKDSGDVQDAACREAEEEAGIKCEPTGTVIVDDDRPKTAFVVCKYVNGDLKSNWEFEKDSLRWVPFEELDKTDNILDINRKVLKKVPNPQFGEGL